MGALKELTGYGTALNHLMVAGVMMTLLAIANILALARRAYLWALVFGTAYAVSSVVFYGLATLTESMRRQSDPSVMLRAQLFVATLCALWFAGCAVQFMVSRRKAKSKSINHASY